LKLEESTDSVTKRPAFSPGYRLCFVTASLF